MRRIIEGIMVTGIFVGFAMLDSNLLVGAIVSLICMGIVFLMEKGVI